jgi:hypothetical protein
MDIEDANEKRQRGTFVQSVLDRSFGVIGSCVPRIVDERELSKEVRSRYQIDRARPARTSPLFFYEGLTF